MTKYVYLTSAIYFAKMDGKNPEQTNNVANNFIYAKPQRKRIKYSYFVSTANCLALLHHSLLLQQLQ